MEEISNILETCPETFDGPDAADYPAWFDGKKVNEVLFCTDFLRDHPMICVHGNFWLFAISCG